MLNMFSKDGIISFLYFLPALLLSISIHEFFHSYVAYKLGDKSQKLSGRLTLNPLAHFDLIGFICIALFGFGWGKPVIVDDSNFKNRARDNVLCAIAGPISNILFAILITVMLKLSNIVGLYGYLASKAFGVILLNMIMLTIQFNIVFAVFNLIPIPPLAGSVVLFYFLPARFKKIMYVLEQYSFIILIVLFISGAYSFLITPAYNLIARFLQFILLL